MHAVAPHDDQVASTVLMLNWFKRGGNGTTTNARIWHYDQDFAEQARPQTPRPAP